MKKAKNRRHINSNKPNKSLADIKKGNRSRTKRLKYQVYVVGLEQDFEKLGYKETDITGYRVVNLPPEAIINFTPQKLMPGRQDMPSIIAKEDLQKLPEKIRKKRIEETAISHFTTKGQCEEMAKQRYRKDLDRMDKAEAEARKKKFGEYIVKLNYKKGDGLVGLIENGHFNFHPYEGVDFKSRIDWQFGVKTLKYETSE